MILKVSTQYKKDLKRYQNKPSKIAALKEVLKHLKKERVCTGRIQSLHAFRQDERFYGVSCRG